jgi:hypothetical protein
MSSIQRRRLLSAYDKFFGECWELFVAKNKDYNDDSDPLSGFRDFGATGIVVRLTDKFGRLKNLFKRGGVSMVVTETLKDTLQDICNYCFLMYAVLEDEKTGFLENGIPGEPDDTDVCATCHADVCRCTKTLKKQTEHLVHLPE